MYIINKIYTIKYEFTEKTWRELLDTRVRWVVAVDVRFRTFSFRKCGTPHADETASRASEKGAHYSENSRESIFYLVGKSRKLPLISPVKDYSDPAIRSLRRKGKVGSGERSQRKEGRRETKIPGGLQPNFRPGSNAVSTEPRRERVV